MTCDALKLSKLIMKSQSLHHISYITFGYWLHSDPNIYWKSSETLSIIFTFATFIFIRQLSKHWCRLVCMWSIYVVSKSPFKGSDSLSKLWLLLRERKWKIFSRIERFCRNNQRSDKSQTMSYTWLVGHETVKETPIQSVSFNFLPD